ncbi:MAG: LysR family transcriptional regulator [Rhodospirillaceae bacterium]|nr:LysR family transcriptional regulator [Rhodospirillaceae bacterium]
MIALDQFDPERFTRELDWNLLRTFLVVVQEGGITSAAARLCVTQPAVSLALKRLERHLGRQLVQRGGGRFRITEAGEGIYREVVEIYGNISRFGMMVRDIREELSGHVRVLLVSRVQTRFLDDAVREFHENHPLVTFRFDVQSAAEVHMGLQQKMGSLGVCLMREPVPGLASEILVRQTYRLYCGASHRLFGQDCLVTNDLRQENFVSFISDQIDGMLSPLAVFRAREGFAGRTVGSSSNLEEVRRMIVCGLGIGPLPEHIAAPDVASGMLWPLPPFDGVAPVDIHVAWNPSARLNPAEEAFIEHLLGKVRDLPVGQRLPG